MTYLGAIALGLVVHAGTRQWLSRGVAGAVGATMTLVAAAPWSFPAVGLAWSAFFVQRRRRRDGECPWEANEFGHILYIALSAGLPVAAALEFAAGEVEASIATEVRSVLRSARRRGLAAALTEAEGSTRPLLAVLARAQVTGSSAMNAVAAHIDEDRKRRRTAAREAAQRLPVKLTVPLALLILPGFVLLTIGPMVIATVERLLGPLLP